MSSKPRILCLEDDKSFIEFYRDRLSQSYEVLCATSLSEAEKLLYTENLRLALVDISLIPNNANDRGGFQFLEKLRSVGLVSDLPTIIVSAYETPTSVRRAFRDFGVVNFFFKQELHPKDLEKTIEDTIAKTYPAQMLGESPRVLIVEDEDDWSEMIKDLLESEGCKTDIAKSYKEAIKKLTGPNFYHLATIDIRLSDLDSSDVRGLELLDTVQRIGLYVDNIVISAVASADQIAQAFTQFGTRDFIAKQEFRREYFRRRVRSLLSHSIYVNVIVGDGTDTPVLKLEKEDTVTISISGKRPESGFSRALARPSIGKFDMEVDLTSYDVDILSGRPEYLTVLSNDTADPVRFTIVPTMVGRTQLTVDLRHKLRILARMSITCEVIE